MGFDYFQILSFSSMIYLFPTFNGRDNSNGKYHKNIIGWTVSFALFKFEITQPFFSLQTCSLFFYHFMRYLYNSQSVTCLITSHILQVKAKLIAPPGRASSCHLVTPKPSSIIETYFNVFSLKVLQSNACTLEGT